MHVHEQGALVRFALMHLIATNVNVWLRTLINEISNEHDHMAHLATFASADSSNSTGKNFFTR
jgi:Otopetrin